MKINFLVTGILFLTGACYTSPYFNMDKPHHHKGGFQNPNPIFQDHGFGAFLKWTSERMFSGVSLDPKDYEIQSTQNDGSVLKDFNGKWSVTWIGHATTLIQIHGFNVLTDPIWSERCSPVSWAGPKRYTEPGLAIDRLPQIHAVLISHNHYDHLDLPTLKILEEKFSPVFFVGLGNQKLLESSGLKKVRELDWWDSSNLEISKKSLKLTFTPTQHFSSRSLMDRNQTLWGSFVLESSDSRIYFAGDTGYFDGFSEIQSRLGNSDLAILPIGAYEPRWFMEPVHVNPEQSVQAFLDLKAEYMLPMHYNTFVLSDEPLDQPLGDTRNFFKKNGIEVERLLDLKIGESFFRN